MNVARIHEEERWLREQPVYQERTSTTSVTSRYVPLHTVTSVTSVTPIYQEAIRAIDTKFTQTKSGLVSTEELERDEVRGGLMGK